MITRFRNDEMSIKLVAIVTGAAQGLGLAISERLGEEGFAVAMADIKSEECEKGAEKLREAGVDARAYSVDVSDEESVQALFSKSEKDLAPLGVVVNNAAIFYEAEFTDISVKEWDRVMAVNLKGAFLCCREAIPRLKSRNWGRIINIASLAGEAGSRVWGAHYAASKAGLINMVWCLAPQLGPFGVTVNAVSPAAVKTPPMDDVNPEKLNSMVESIPVRRVGQPEEVADLVAFLCSDSAGFINGATVDINGGIFMR